VNTLKLEISMFTGIIEAAGVVSKITREGTNVHFDLDSDLASELKTDQSLAHDGVCLTVVQTSPKSYRITAINETISKTNLMEWNVGKSVNLERSMPANGRFDGHVVQGHVDQTGKVKTVTDEGGSWLFDLEFDSQYGNITVEKGSITINGTSLTCFNSGPGRFSVAIIPYTYEHTNFHQLKAGDLVNLEFDILGKYIQRIIHGYELP